MLFDFEFCKMAQQRSGSGSLQSPRSPSPQAPFLSVSVTDPAKMGNGVQAYISYKVITKVVYSLPSLFHLLFMFIHV